VTPPGGEERWIDSIVFDDDRCSPRGAAVSCATSAARAWCARRASRGGVLRAARDVVLERWP
jgi:hypothetical protein